MESAKVVRTINTPLTRIKTLNVGTLEYDRCSLNPSFLAMRRCFVFAKFHIYPYLYFLITLYKYAQSDDGLLQIRKYVINTD